MNNRLKTRDDSEEFKVIITSSDEIKNIDLQEVPLKKDDDLYNYKKYLLWVTFFYLIKKIPSCSQIRSYRDKNVDDILSAIKYHTTIDSLKKDIKSILYKTRHPGFFKSMKRMFHGSEFPTAMAKALEEGENKSIHQLMGSIKIDADRLKVFLKEVSKENKEYTIKNKLLGLFGSKEENKGDDPGYFKRYLFLFMYKFIIDKINKNESIPEEIIFQKIIPLLEYPGNSDGIHQLKGMIAKIEKESKDDLFQKKKIFQANIEFAKRKEEKIFAEEELEKIDIIIIKYDELFSVLDKAINIAEGNKLQTYIGMSYLIPPLEKMLTSLKEAVGVKNIEHDPDDSLEKNLKRMRN